MVYVYMLILWCDGYISVDNMVDIYMLIIWCDGHISADNTVYVYMLIIWFGVYQSIISCFSHLRVVPLGVSKSVKKLQKRNVPKLSQYSDISQFLLE